MTEILTITLKPAVDYSTSTEHVTAGPKLYCRKPRIDPGGGGVNVARVIARLGGTVKAFVVAGGPTGDRLLALLAAEQIRVEECRLSGETCFSLAVTDEETGEQFRFSLPGEPVNADEARILLDRISAAAPRNGIIVLSGGIANSLANDFPQQVQGAVSRSNGRLVVDTSKAPLMHLINAPIAPVEVLRLDHSEIEKAADRSLHAIADNFEFAEMLVRRGVARIVVAGHGAEGSVMVDGDRKFFCHAPKVVVRSKIGAGDAFVGAFTLSLARGETSEDALTWGVAAASATVSTEGTALCEASETKALLSGCRLERY